MKAEWWLNKPLNKTFLRGMMASGGVFGGYPKKNPMKNRCVGDPSWLVGIQVGWWGSKLVGCALEIQVGLGVPQVCIFHGFGGKPEVARWA